MQLGFWQKTAVYITASIVGVSGLLWFILHDVLAENLDDLTHLSLMLHGVSAYALLVLIGSLLPVHVRWGWLRRRNLLTGLIVTATMAILTVTALVLYYGSEEIQVPGKWVHLAFGLGSFVVFPAHAFMGLKKRHPALSSDVKQGVPTLSTERG